MKDSRLDKVEKELLHHPDPVVKTTELAEELEGVGRRDVLDDLRLLEREGTAVSKSIGASAVAWWHVDRVVPAPPRDPADHPDQRGLAETTRAHNARVSESTGSGSTFPNDGLSDGVNGDIEAALEGWDPGRSSQERRERRRVGAEVLRWLRDVGQPVSRSDVVTALYDTHSFDGQSEDAWWRKVARPALKCAAENGYVDDSGRKYGWGESKK